MSHIGTFFANRRSRGIAGALTLLVMLLSNANAERPPNILWICKEDMSAFNLGAYGNKLVKTPVLDALASEGMLYTNAFSNNPVCSPSRSATITGMYPSTIDAHNHRSHHDKEKAPYVDGYPLPAPVKPIPQYFKEAGYYTAMMGSGKEDYNFTYSGKAWDGKHWKDRGEKPFFAYIHISKSGGDRSKSPVSPADVIVPPYYADTPLVREDLAIELNGVSNEADGKLKKILEELKSDGLADNTIVFYFTDHGHWGYRGKQWLYEGGIHVPLIVRGPGITPGVSDELVSLIDLVPTSLRLAGIEPPAYLQGIEFLGPEATTQTHVIATRDRMDETFDRMRAVRTKDLKYIRNFYPELPYSQYNAHKDGNSYPHYAQMLDMHKQGQLNEAQSLYFAPRKPAEELYDMVNDPYEVNNLAGMTEHDSSLQRMRGYLDDWLRVNDPVLGRNDKAARAEKATSLFIINPSTSMAGMMDVTFSVGDRDGRDCSLKVEYSLNESAGPWYDAYLDTEVSAHYGAPVLDNSAPYQISNITTGFDGGNIVRFRWDTRSESNGKGSMRNTVEDKVKLRVTRIPFEPSPYNGYAGMKEGDPVESTGNTETSGGFMKPQSGPAADNRPFAVDNKNWPGE